VLGGRYRLGEQIGSGGMAKVYRAEDGRLDRPVAVKILSAQFSSDPSFVDRFRREAQTAAKLSHPNIVGVYDNGSEDDTHYIVMEFVEGRTLDEFLAGGGRLSPTKAVEVVEAICDALDARVPLPDGRPRRNLITFVTDRPGHDRRYAIDCDKIERELGWKQSRDFEQGLADTVDWYLANGWWWRPLRERYAGERLGKAQ